MEPENQQLEKEKHLPKASFLGSMLVSWSVYTLFLAAKKKLEHFLGPVLIVMMNPYILFCFYVSFPSIHLS